MDLRSPLGKAKGLGSAKNGVHHWLVQRLTAVALIPLVIWFVVTVIKASTSANHLIDYLHSPVNSTAMILFICLALYHGCLGMKVVIEDYVHCECGKTILITLINFFSIFTAVLTVVAVLYVHFGNYHQKGRDNFFMSGEDIGAKKEQYQKWQEKFYNKLKESNIEGK